MHINQFFSCLICSVTLSTAAQLSQSAYFALQCPYTVFGLGRTPNFVDDLAVGMPGSIKRVRIGLWYKAKHFRGITGDCRLAAPTDFIRGIPAGKLDSFRLDYVSERDERGSVINNYLW